MGNLFSQPTSTVADRGLSNELWNGREGGCPRHEIRDNPGAGYYFDDRFMRMGQELTVADAQDWIVTNATNGTFAHVTGDTNVYGGERVLDTGDGTDARGVASAQVPHASFLPEAGTIITCEFMFETDVLLGDWFIGLAEVDTSVINSGANTTANHVGFESVTGNGVVLQQSEKGGVRNTAIDTPKTLVAATKIKLGFRITGVTKIEYYIDGVKTPTDITTASGATTPIPAVTLVPTLSLLNSSSDRVKWLCEWFACYAERRKV